MTDMAENAISAPVQPILVKLGIGRYFRTGKLNFGSNFEYSEIQDGGNGIKCYVGPCPADLGETW